MAIVFGQTLYGEIETILGSDYVLTSELEKQTYPFKIKLHIYNLGSASEDYSSLERTLRAHACLPLHIEMTESEYENFTTKDNYAEDERIIFVTT